MAQFVAEQSVHQDVVLELPRERDREHPPTLSRVQDLLAQDLVAGAFRDHVDDRFVAGLQALVLGEQLRCDPADGIGERPGELPEVGALDQREAGCQVPELGHHGRRRDVLHRLEAFEFGLDAGQPETALVVVVDRLTGAVVVSEALIERPLDVAKFLLDVE